MVEGEVGAIVQEDQEDQEVDQLQQLLLILEQVIHLLLVHLKETLVVQLVHHLVREWVVVEVLEKLVIQMEMV